MNSIGGPPVGLRAVCLLGSTIRSRRFLNGTETFRGVKLSTIGGYPATGIPFASREPLQGDEMKEIGMVPVRYLAVAIWARHKTFTYLSSNTVQSYVVVDKIASEHLGRLRAVRG